MSSTYVSSGETPPCKIHANVSPVAPQIYRGGMQGGWVALVGAYNPSKIAAYNLEIGASKLLSSIFTPYPWLPYWVYAKNVSERLVDA